MVSNVEREISKCIDDNSSFIIEAGAGSGKTWSLVQSLFYIIETKGEFLRKRSKKVACITYTNVAKEEIIERTRANELIDVRTIHEFLWDLIKPFQKQLKIELCNLIQEKINKENETISNSKPTTQKYKKAIESSEKYQRNLEELQKYQGKIQYKEYYNRKNGIISHNDIIWLSNKIFDTYPNIYKILQDTYPIIFIDEYQDTDKKIAETILEKVKPNTSILFGLFGDYNQQIYGNSIGKIDAEKYNLKVIAKDENYRCSVEVINLLNKLRTDIIQRQTGEEKHGKCICYYVNDPEIDTEQFLENHVYNDLQISPSSEVKKLYLVTKSIARKNGYLELHDLYDEENKDIQHRRPKKKDQLLKNKDNRDCPFANHLYDIEEMLELFNEKRIQLLLKKTSFEINSIADKTKLNNLLIEVGKMTKEKTIKEMFEFIWSNKLLQQPEKIKDFLKDGDLQDDFFNTLMNMKYLQFQNLYYTVKETSPFSTNHGTKGAEFDTVVCFINDSDWSNYNFNNYFDKTDEGKTRFDRTNNLFYVICSRAKFNLAIVIMSELSSEAVVNLKLLFG